MKTNSQALCFTDKELMSFNNGKITISLHSISLAGTEWFLISVKNNTLDDWEGEPMLLRERKAAIGQFNDTAGINA